MVYALSNSFGFGGTNATLVFKRENFFWKIIRKFEINILNASHRATENSLKWIIFDLTLTILEEGESKKEENLKSFSIGLLHYYVTPSPLRKIYKRVIGN